MKEALRAISYIILSVIVSESVPPTWAVIIYDFLSEYYLLVYFGFE